jgi:hypothetical protein
VKTACLSRTVCKFDASKKPGLRGRLKERPLRDAMDHFEIKPQKTLSSRQDAKTQRNPKGRFSTRMRAKEILIWPSQRS